MQKVQAALYAAITFLGKSALYIGIFLLGVVMFVTAKNATTQDSVVFNQNVGAGIATTGLVLLIMYWWRLDATEKIQKELTEQKTKIQSLNSKLDAIHTLLQQTQNNSQEKDSQYQTDVQSKLDLVTSKLSIVDSLPTKMARLEQEIMLLKPKSRRRQTLYVARTKRPRRT